MHTIARSTTGSMVGSMMGSLFLAAFLVSGSVWADAVDINHADAATIAKELKGIGPAHAQAIVEYREKHGAFKSVDDLTKIKGVGTKVIEKNRANIRLGDASKK